MKSTIYMDIDGGATELIQVNTFPGGEVQVKVDDPYRLQSAKQVAVYTKLRCAEGVQALIQLKSIIDHYGFALKTNLYLGYAPYARQDRICDKGEALAAKVFADQINNINFDNVITVDNHSEVMSAVLNNCVNLTKIDISHNVSQFHDMLEQYDVFVAPDLGASKEIEELARLFGKQFVQGTKHRDPKTGNLSGFGHYCPEGGLDGKRVLIIDDICDGGGTFAGLLNDLVDNHTMETCSLYVTHGIFSKGVTGLTTAFDEVYTTDTLIDCEGTAKEQGLTIIKLLEF